MNTRSRLARIIGLLAACAVLAGCNAALKLGYNNIDTAAYWWLDGYVAFTDSQSPRVRSDISRLHQWHRSSELPRFVSLLRRLEGVVPGEISAAQVCELVPELRERANAVAEQAEPSVVTLALGLAPEQLDVLERKYRDNDDDYRKDWVELTPAELKDKRFKLYLERSEIIYGRLGPAQRTILRQQLENSVFDPKRIQGERKRRQQDLLQTLRRLQAPGTSLTQARSVMRAYFDRAQESADPAYRSYQETLLQEGCRSIAATHNSTTPVQREAAVQRLRDYRRDLSELAAQR